MRTNCIASGAARQYDVGAVYKEVLSGAQGTLELLPHQSFRVRATGATTVTVEGILAATMSSNEVMIFNAGPSKTGTPFITVVIAGANAFVQTMEQ
jgi:hypothetical protein